MSQPTLRLSQAQLNLLTTCPRKFQYVCLEQRAAPAPPGQQERARWGNQFHLLMQQRELALPLEPLFEIEPQFEATLHRLRQAAPDLFATPSQGWRAAEHSRSLMWENFLLTAVYDLLIAEPQQARIIDWKTYLQARPRPALARDWQTRLYLFLLAETTDYRPEQLSLTYWFVKVAPQPQALVFPYDRDQHERARQDLQTLLARLTVLLGRHQAGELLPQVPAAAGHCQHCPFMQPCGRTAEVVRPEAQDWRAAIATIAEVSL